MSTCSIKDVAHKAGVSIATVSRIINKSPYPVSEKVRKKVEKVIMELNYIPNNSARNLRTQKSRVIGLIVRDIGDPYFGEIARGVTESALELDYLTMVCNSMRDKNYELKYYDILVQQQFEGVIIAGGGFTDPLSKDKLEKNIDTMLKKGMKVVALAPQGFDVPIVSVHNFQVGKMICDYLVERNHRRIAFIGGSLDHITSHSRWKGYLESLTQHGLEIKDDLMAYGDYTWTGGYNSCKELLERKEEFTAICVINDNLAIGVLRCLQEHGIRVPREVSVISVGDLPPSMYITPPLTTARIPFYEIGKKAAEILIKEEDLKGLEYFYQASIVERESVSSLL